MSRAQRHTEGFRPSKRLYDENYLRCRLHSGFNFLWYPHTMRDMRCEAVVTRKRCFKTRKAVG
eukprot:843656-Rhodomonas_salina.1